MQEPKNTEKKLLSHQVGAYIEFTAGDEQGRLCAIVFSKTIFGRKNADILVRDIKVSSSHLSLDWSPQGFRVTDLQSSNGVLVQGKKVTQTLVGFNQDIQIGDTVFCIRHNETVAQRLLQEQHSKAMGAGEGLTGVITQEFFSQNFATSVLDPPSKKIDVSLKTIRLKILDGPDKNKIFALKKPLISIGRVHSDLVLHDPDVSRKHATLEIEEGGQVILRDLASSNGTFVNKIRITNCMISPKDQIQVGRTLILFEGTFTEP